MSAIELPALGLPGKLDGIDVSSCQAVAIDWAKVHDAGFRFAGVKVTEGLGRDSWAHRHADGARNAGLAWLAYVFFRFSVDPAAQIDALWASLGDTMPARLVIDAETAAATVDGHELHDRLRKAVDRALEYAALPPVIYSGVGFLARMGSELAADEVLGNCPAWFAQYASTTTAWAPSAISSPRVVAPWKTWTLWQYSGDGGYRVPGVPGVDCDRNLYNGDEASFLRDLVGNDGGGGEAEPAIVHPSPFSDG